jgi:hypothetical protein
MTLDCPLRCLLYRILELTAERPNSRSRFKESAWTMKVFPT